MLVLDEPTNDLDIQTLNLLEDFLLDFPGCVLVVSHDRYFLDRVADHLFVLDGVGALKDFPGNYSGYREWKKEQERQAAEELKNQTKKPEVESARQVKLVSKPTWAEKKEYEQLIIDIARLEKRKLELSDCMNSGTGSPDQLMGWSTVYGEVVAELDTCELRWLELDEKM
ncbi:MAG: hypothetical protein CVU06_15140 [Bacteroidetes bacterium HGW-Bacteroidetes-22]|nr:MAG: hypothetical protein CVU06_15140 [Bacteroidetes bacterium HGW-Bacteroidetes-22]